MVPRGVKSDKLIEFGSNSSDRIRSDLKLHESDQVVFFMHEIMSGRVVNGSDYNRVGLAQIRLEDDGLLTGLAGLLRVWLISGRTNIRSDSYEIGLIG